MRASRRVAIVAAGLSLIPTAALLVLLSGCGPLEVPTSPGIVAIRADGDGVAIGLCQTRIVTGTHIRMFIK